jgi:hypothetical protein
VEFHGRYFPIYHIPPTDCPYETDTFFLSLVFPGDCQNLVFLPSRSSLHSRTELSSSASDISAFGIRILFSRAEDEGTRRAFDGHRSPFPHTHTPSLLPPTVTMACIASTFTGSVAALKASKVTVRRRACANPRVG